MSDHPDGAALLAQARITLLEEIVPGLSDEPRFLALMVANAMAIAGREMQQREAAESGLLTELMALLKSEGESAEASLKALAKAIRAGQFDGDPMVHDLLLREVRQRLALSNPKQITPESR